MAKTFRSKDLPSLPGTVFYTLVGQSKHLEGHLGFGYNYGTIELPKLAAMRAWRSKNQRIILNPAFSYHPLVMPGNGHGSAGPAGVGLCVLCQPIVSNIITMATFDVSGVLYRDPETGCASTSDNQIAYEECRQSYYAKQQTQKTTTTLAPATTDPKPTATDSTLNAEH